MQRWAALLAGCTGNVSAVRAVPSVVLKSAAERAAILTAVRRAATVPRKPTNTLDSACQSVPRQSYFIFLTHSFFLKMNIVTAKHRIEQLGYFEQDLSIQKFKKQNSHSVGLYGHENAGEVIKFKNAFSTPGKVLG